MAATGMFTSDGAEEFKKMSRFYFLGVAQSPKQLKRDRWSIVRLVADVKQNMGPRSGQEKLPEILSNYMATSRVGLGVSKTGGLRIANTTASAQSGDRPSRFTMSTFGSTLIPCMVIVQRGAVRSESSS
jgi:hypothetical protein